MKKVLFISLSPSNTLGGTQHYNYKLMKIFNELGWNITEYNCNLGFDKVVREDLDYVKRIDNKSKLKPSNNRIDTGIKFMKQVKSSNLEIAKLVSENKYDLIIDSRQHPYTWQSSWGDDIGLKDNTIWVQHFCLGVYDGYCITNNPIESFFVSLYINHFSKYRYNVLYSHSNIVLFDKFNEEKIQIKRFKKKPKINTINLSEYNKQYLKKQLRSNVKKTIDFLYVGRIDNIQKNFNYIYKTFKGSNNKLVVIGQANEKINKKIKRNNNIDYLGIKSQDEVINYLKKSKFLFLPSRYEGFPFVLVQALSHGCTPIILDTYESVPFFKNVSYLFNKNTPPKVMRKELDNIKNNYSDKLHFKNIKFAMKNLCNENFEREWKNIIRSY